MGEASPAPFEQSTCAQECTAAVPPPSSTDRGDVPSLGLVAAAVCAPELPRIAKGQSRGDDSLLIATDRGTTRSQRAVCSEPGRRLSGSPLTPLLAGEHLGDSGALG